MRRKRDTAEDHVRTAVAALDDVSLQRCKHLCSLTAGCSYGLVVIGECMVSTDKARLLAAKG